MIQDIEPNGQIHRDGRLRVNDNIVAINGISLIGINFYTLVVLPLVVFVNAIGTVYRFFFLVSFHYLFR